MTKTCFVCGKSRMAGRTIQHQHGGKWMYKAPKKPRVFKINTKKIDMDVNGTIVRADVCMKCYKKLRKTSEE
ncbi:MAG TPA: L28 family ribosomal protein [Candidatus Dojkabacteria bacterium]|nr:L28 family ribosomal protein [Candidatus Dojkabacteria bacterium]